jgi:hypothetical protein
VQLRDCAVYAARQPEVVRIDDEAAHRVSLSTPREDLPIPSASWVKLCMLAGMMKKAVVALKARVGG